MVPAPPCARASAVAAARSPRLRPDIRTVAARWLVLIIWGLLEVWYMFFASPGLGTFSSRPSPVSGH